MADDDFQTNDNTQADDTAGQQPLPEDQATPFADPDDVSTEDNTDEQLANQPQTDTGIDEHEQYDEGIAGAAEINPPAKPSSVLPNDDVDLND